MITPCVMQTILKKNPYRLYFISTSLLIKIKQISICRISGTHNNGTRISEHRAIKFHISVYHNERGKGYSKLNMSECNEYKRQVSKIITDVSKEDGSSTEKWESLKVSKIFL